MNSLPLCGLCDEEVLSGGPVVAGATVCARCLHEIFDDFIKSMRHDAKAAMAWLGGCNSAGGYYYGAESDTFERTIGEMAALFAAGRGRRAQRCLAVVQRVTGDLEGKDWTLCLQPSSHSYDLGPAPDKSNVHIPLCDQHIGHRGWSRVRDDGSRWRRCGKCQETKLVPASSQVCIACQQSEVTALLVQAQRLEKEAREARKRIAKAEIMGGRPALVYYIYDREGQCIRIGHTTDWDNRKKFYRGQPWSDDIDWSTITLTDWFPTVGEAKLFEAAEIARLDPCRNDHHRRRVRVSA